MDGQQFAIRYEGKVYVTQTVWSYDPEAQGSSAEHQTVQNFLNSANWDDSVAAVDLSTNPSIAACWAVAN